jgi:hypothetical protein
LSHNHLGVSSSVDDSVVLDGVHENAKNIMNGSLSLVKDMIARSSNDKSAGLT